MTAPLSSFMSQLLDDSVNHFYQESAATVVVAGGSFDQEVEENIDDVGGEALHYHAQELHSTGNKLNGHGSNNSYNSPSGYPPAQVSPTTVVDSEKDSQEAALALSSSSMTSVTKRTTTATTTATAVPDKKALRRYRQSFRDEVVSPLGTTTAIRQPPSRQESVLDESASIALDHDAINSQTFTGNRGHGSSNSTAMNHSSSSLSKFMTELLNNSDIERLIREGDHSTYATSSAATSEENRVVAAGGDENDGESTLKTGDNNNKNSNAEESKSSIALSEGAANAAAFAVGEYNGSESRSKNQNHMPSTTARDNNNGMLRDTSECQKNDTDKEASKSTIHSSSGRNARQPGRYRHTRKKSTSQDTLSPSLADPRDIDSSVEATKDCIAQIGALIRPKERNNIDAYDCVYDRTDRAMAQNSPSERMPRQPTTVRRNSDSSLLSPNAPTIRASGVLLNRSDETVNIGLLLHDAATTQSFSIGGLRKELKKSHSLSQLRQHMTQLQLRESIYSSSLLGVDDGGADDINKSSRLLYLGVSGRSGICTDALIEKESERAIQVSEGTARKAARVEKKMTRARSSTPRKHRASSSNKQRASKLKGSNKSKRASSVDSHMNDSTSKSNCTSKKNRRRTPSSTRKRASSVVTTLRATSVTVKEKGRSKSKKVARPKSVSTRHGRSIAVFPDESAPVIPSKPSRGKQSAENKMRDESSKRDLGASSRQHMDDRESKRERRSSVSSKPRVKSPSSRTRSAVKSPSTRTRTANTSANPATTSRVKSPSTRTRLTPAKVTEDSTQSAVTTTSGATRRSNTGIVSRTPLGLKTSKTNSSGMKTPSASRRKHRKSIVGEDDRTKSASKKKVTRSKTVDSLFAVPKAHCARRRSSASGGVEGNANLDFKTSKRSKMAGSLPPVTIPHSARTGTTSMIGGRQDTVEHMSDASEPEHHTLHFLPKTPSTRRRASLPGGGNAPQSVESDGMVAQPILDESKAGHYRTIIAELDPKILSAKKITKAEMLSASLRRKREGNNHASASSLLDDVSSGSPPQRHQMDPAPQTCTVPILGKAEVPETTTEMERRRLRSKATGPAVSAPGMDSSEVSHRCNAGKGRVPTSKKKNGMNNSDQVQQISYRRNASKRNKMQAQQSLLNALDQEAEAQKKALEEANRRPLLAAPPESGGNGSQGAWLSRRKNHMVSQRALSPS